MPRGVRGLGGWFVLVDESAEDGFAVYPALVGEVDDLGGRPWWSEIETAVGRCSL